MDYYNHTTAVIVLYNPNDSELNNIKLHNKYFKEIQIIDNSEYSNIDKLINREIDKFDYVFNGENRGIAFALNQGVKKAITKQFEYCLLLDQDSQIDQYSINELYKHNKQTNNCFITVPLINDESVVKFFPSPPTNFKEIKAFSSSGSMLKLKYIQSVGLHKEDLFIDYVDFEYCLRARARGFHIIQVLNATLKHKLGSRTKIKYLWWTFYPTNHITPRRYYKTRNMFYVWSKYFLKEPTWVLNKMGFAIKEYILIILCEKNKLRKFIASIYGFLDFLLSRYHNRYEI